MNPAEVLVATRSPHKLREILAILHPPDDVRLVSLAELQLPESAEEEELERFASFDENALAKARFFARRSGRLTLADDSGLCVDALGGLPGVRSKRFSGRPHLSGAELDAANNELLLRSLDGVPPGERTARYVCAVALAGPRPHDPESVFRGSCEGFILPQPRGHGGFGYDPLFFFPPDDASFAQVSPDRKNRLSHRGRALRAARAQLLRRVDEARSLR